MKWMQIVLLIAAGAAWVMSGVMKARMNQKNGTPTTMFPRTFLRDNELTDEAKIYRDKMAMWSILFVLLMLLNGLCYIYYRTTGY